MVLALQAAGLSTTLITPVDCFAMQTMQQLTLLLRGHDVAKHDMLALVSAVTHTESDEQLSMDPSFVEDANILADMGMQQLSATPTDRYCC